MPKVKPLPPHKLRAEFPASKVPYADSTAIPENGKSAPPQPRALMALEQALLIADPGYNVFVAGEPNLGRTYLVKGFLSPRAARMPAPPDILYLYNFADPDRPKATTLPAGRGRALKTALAEAMEAVRRDIPALFEQEAFQQRRESLFKAFQDSREDLLREMEQAATTQGFDLDLDDQGSMTLYPLVEGKVVSEADFERLDPTLRKTLKSRGDRILESMTASLRTLSAKERDYRKSQVDLEKDAVSEVLKEHLGPLAGRFADIPALIGFFAALREDVLDNLDQFLPRESLPAPTPAAPVPAHVPLHSAEGSAEDFFVRYGVNLFVDNGQAKGAPIVVEDHPTPANLLGVIEREAEMGALYTDFSLIKAGSLHRACGGFLILHCEDILSLPEAWEGLLRALRAGLARIEDPGDHEDRARTKTIEPDPVPLAVKVILIGTDETYELLLTHDDRFAKLFKLKAHLQDTVERTPAAIRTCLRALVRIIREARLLPFDREALAGMVDFATRLAGDQKKLALHLPLARELMIESEALARSRGRTKVGREHVDAARRNRRFRANLYEEEFMADYDRQLIKVQTSGRAVGRANGLAVTLLGDYEFGLPHQIACNVGVGHGGILDLEREAELGGPIHTKGMMILKSYLLGLFAQDKPLVLTGSLCFEQSYVEVEGDSASGAELAALLSALAEAPLSLSLAFTGAVSHSGGIMAVGGVTRKVEGFFQVCKRRGLTGEQGVIIPADNVLHLMCGDEVVEAVRAGQFHIYPVTTIEQAMELLTGLPAGRRRAGGGFTAGSLYHRVDNRLRRLAK
ncbi:MAG: AAA family ATPase, partial [Desulfovibrionaceae bacterium]|nr:AAA family ATPase [Desulfovibrionaceae bacterium]